MPYPSFLYQHQAGSNKFHLDHRHAEDADNLPFHSPSTKFSRIKHPCLKGNLSSLQVDHDLSSRYDLWGLSAESPLASTLTEDDFLEMVLGPVLACPSLLCVMLLFYLFSEYMKYYSFK